MPETEWVVSMREGSRDGRMPVQGQDIPRRRGESGRMLQLPKIAKRIGLVCILNVLFAISSWSQAGPISGQIIQPPAPAGTGGPAAFASVRICPITGTGTPCSPLASLYSDLALTQPVSNPYTTDQYGNYSVFAAFGYYIVQVSATPSITYSYLQTASSLVNVFSSNPGSFAVGTNNLFTQSTVGTASAGSVLAGFDSSGLVACCLSDALTGAVTVPSSAANVQADAVAGYIQNNSTTLGGGIGGGAVGGYFVSTCNATNARCWGANTVVSDSPGVPAANLASAELDLAVYNTSTVGEGLLLNGNFHVQPTVLPAIDILKATAGTGTWTDGLRIGDGATSSNIAVNVMAQSSGNNVSSQIVEFTGRDSGGTTHTTFVGGTQNGDTVLQPASGRGVQIGGPSVLANVQVFNGTPSGTCANTTLGINAAAGSNSTVLYVCLATTSTWTAVTIP